MKKKLIFLLSCASFLSVQAQLSAEDHTLFVNPFIGTQTDETGSLSGSTFPGATLPQGMVQLSPETENYVTWDPCCGYDYNKDVIYGFTHTHLSGTGCTDLIDVSLMPAACEVTPEMLSKGEFGLSFSHENECAVPGYYSVRLGESGINAEMSATVHTGIHRYTFPEGMTPRLVLDMDRMSYRGEAYYTGRRAYQIIQGQIRFIDDKTIEGYRVLTGWAKLRKVYFRAEFSKPIRSRILMDGNRNVGASPVVNGRALRAALEFDPDDREVMVKVSISAVDGQGARQNMAAEASLWDFDSYRQAAHDSWKDALSIVDVEGTDEQKTIFYTGLYHVLMQPNTMSDVDGRYMNTNFEINRMPEGKAYHSTFSLWDTFRAAHPLYTLLLPDTAAAFVNDMLLHHETYGYLPIWDLWGQDNYCMIGNHSIPVISDAILAEIPGVDKEAAYKAMVESSTRSHPNSPFEIWEKYGYLPGTLQNGSVSITMEQAFDDWCVAAVAKKLGRQEDYEKFMNRSMFYKNLFDRNTGFFRPKDENGEWMADFDPLSYESSCFVEGNAWQYMWFVPQDPQGLIELLGGKEAFLKKLDENFTLSVTSGKVDGNASGFIGQYAHGNEPSHHTVYLYTLAGEPRRTQELVDHVRRAFYNATPCGYAGNDDCGQMSAWYIFSSLGFYPVNAGSAEYVIGTPLFDKAVLHLAGGKDFTINVSRGKAGSVYVKRVCLNGRTVKDWRLAHRQIADGGSLDFVLE